MSTKKNGVGSPGPSENVSAQNCQGRETTGNGVGEGRGAQMVPGSWGRAAAQLQPGAPCGMRAQGGQILLFIF